METRKGRKIREKDETHFKKLGDEKNVQYFSM